MRLALTYLPNYRRIWQPVITGAILHSGLVWVIHRAFVAEGGSDWGYAGNMLILSSRTSSAGCSSAFDALAERFGLEKIKTIGDALHGGRQRPRAASG